MSTKSLAMKMIKQQSIPVEERFLNDLTTTMVSVGAAMEVEALKASKSAGTIRPSSLHCIRQMYYRVTKVHPEQKKKPYNNFSITQIGTARHLHIQNAVQAMGIEGFNCEFLDVGEYIKANNLPLKILKKATADDPETRLYSKKYNTSFACDGIIRYQGDLYLLEIKTEQDDKWQQREQMNDYHVWQVSAYCALLGLDKSLMLYEDRKFCNIKSFNFEVTTEMKEKVLTKLKSCLEYAKNNELPPKEADRRVCGYCDYSKRCGGELT